MRLLMDSFETLRDKILGVAHEQSARERAVNTAKEEARQARYRARQAALQAIANSPHELRDIDMSEPG